MRYSPTRGYHSFFKYFATADLWLNISFQPIQVNVKNEVAESHDNAII